MNRKLAKRSAVTYTYVLGVLFTFPAGINKS